MTTNTKNDECALYGIARLKRKKHGRMGRDSARLNRIGDGSTSACCAWTNFGRRSVLEVMTTVLVLRVPYVHDFLLAGLDAADVDASLSFQG